MSFDAVKNGKPNFTLGSIRYTILKHHIARPHFWISTILDAGFLVTLLEVFRRFPLFKPLIIMALPWDFWSQITRHMAYSKEKVQARISNNQNIDRIDFFSNLLSEKSPDSSERFMLAQANVLVVAGSDTTSIFLTAATYYLLKNPEKMKLLVEEIRGAYHDAGQIDSSSTQRLSYLCAVVEEGLRIFPPASFGLPRISPGAFVDGTFIPKGVSFPFLPTL